MIRELHANTLEIPVAWEQIEPREGRFDFSCVDALIQQARQNNVRLVLLWFGTWKNTEPGYTPEWVKSDTEALSAHDRPRTARRITSFRRMPVRRSRRTSARSPR